MTSSNHNCATDRQFTLAETLFFLEDPVRRLELEEFRIRFEANHGPTDLTKRYTSTWPAEQQEILRRMDIKKYFEGLPPFAQAYVRCLMFSRKRTGNLDDTPDDLLSLFLAGDCDNKQQGHGRH